MVVNVQHLKVELKENYAMYKSYIFLHFFIFAFLHFGIYLELPGQNSNFGLFFKTTKARAG